MAVTFPHIARGRSRPADKAFRVFDPDRGLLSPPSLDDRLPAEHADRMAGKLLTMAIDENVSDAVKLAAIHDALDRAGLSAKTAVSVEVGTRPFEVIFDDIAGGSRAQSRARRSVPDD